MTIDAVRRTLDRSADHEIPAVALALAATLRDTPQEDIASIFLLVVARMLKGKTAEPTQEAARVLSARGAALLTGWTNGSHGGLSPNWFRKHAATLPCRIGSVDSRPLRFSRSGVLKMLEAGK